MSASISTFLRREPLSEGGVVAFEIGGESLVLLFDQAGVDRSSGFHAIFSTQRVNACALPASTFRMFPVELCDRSEAKKRIASAMSSGSTFCLSKLRSR